MNARRLILSVFAVLDGACTPGRLDAIDPPSATVGLIAHYTFDEDGGTVVVDHSGNHHNGILDGGTWIADGKFGGALHFDGQSTVTVNDFPDAPPSFTVSTWVRVAAFADDAGLETVTSTEYVFDAGWQLNIGPSDAGSYFQAAYWDRVSSAYTFSDCTCLPEDAWTQFAFVVDGHTLATYVNGGLVSQVPAPNPITPGTPALLMGYWSMSGRMLVGDLDDMNIYGRALTADEIMSLYQAPPPDLP